MSNQFSWFGIDFGTTNSAAFSYTGVNRDYIVPIAYGDNEGRPFPSIVAIDKENGTVITGREAKERKNELLETCYYFSSIKSIMDSTQTWEIAGRIWTPEDIAAEILKALKDRVENDSDNHLNEAVVAVPNGFSHENKKHLRNAAKKAGFSIPVFIGEPTAAFCSNYNELKSCKNVVVFDWGGGTLDVTVLKTESGKIWEEATSGMKFAGDDIDKKIAEKMHAKFSKKKGINVSFEDLNPVTRDQLISKCEKAKCDFEDEEIVSISINKYDEFGPVRDSMDYEYFKLLIEEDINNAMRCLSDAIKKAGKNSASIDRILCVGGSSKLRPLQERLAQEYGEEMIYCPNRVMWDIAKGAAISSSRANSFCANQDIGILLSDGSIFNLLDKGQPLPCDEKEISFAIVDDEKVAKVVISDSDDPQKRTFIETITIPARGFLGEHFLIASYVDDDFIFNLRIRSNYSYKEKYYVWKYNNLKLYWDVLSGGTN